jgi:sugar lactone lactonase YvrE
MVPQTIRRTTSLPGRRRVCPLVLLAWCAALALLACAPAGAAVTQIGGPGAGDGTFQVPGPVALDTAGDLYVLDVHGETLQKFSDAGAFIKRVEGGLSSQDVGGLAIGEHGEVFVAYQNLTEGEIVRFNSSLEERTPIATGKFSSLAANGKHLYALSTTAKGEYVVTSFNGVSEEGSFTFPIGSGNGQLAKLNNNPAIHDQIAVDPSGKTLYVTDADNQRVVELASAPPFTMTGTTLSGLSGYAQGVATGTVGGQTQVYVGDDNFAGTAFVRRYSPSGTLLGSIAVAGAHGGLASDA